MTRIDNALAAAKAEARRRIEHDGQRQTAAVKQQLDAVSQRLFDPVFDAAKIAAEPYAQRQFLFSFGVSPKGYRDRILLDTARRLICETETPITEIAVGLGFPEPETFSRWFKYRTGLSPMKLREEHRPRVEKRPTRPPQSSPKAPDFPLSPSEWRRMILGGATREAALEFVQWLHEAYPEAFADAPLPTE